jgi:hypothetical protein
MTPTPWSSSWFVERSGAGELLADAAQDEQRRARHRLVGPRRGTRGRLGLLRGPHPVRFALLRTVLVDHGDETRGTSADRQAKVAAFVAELCNRNLRNPGAVAEEDRSCGVVHCAHAGADEGRTAADGRRRDVPAAA